jgi:hypothetical protein
MDFRTKKTESAERFLAYNLKSQVLVRKNTAQQRHARTATKRVHLPAKGNASQE